MLTCGRCGQESPDGFRFCGACAAPLAQDAPEVREERRIVTALFADLVGFTARAERLDPEDVRAVLAPYHARLRSELERYGGTVEKFIGDAVMALFGAPVAHEDDPERAVRAALAIRDWVAEQEENLQVRIAVNTGEALVALDARPGEGEGMASGDVVNTAARLQAAAPVNGILVGETTYRATKQAIDYREAEQVQAKGKAEPIPVWEAVQTLSRFGVDVRQPVRAPLFGRRRELDVLLDALDRARRERSPQLVTLVGEPGIGKSRLVYELFQAVDADPELIYWRQGRSLPYGEGVTFWALAEMLKSHADILETDTARTAERKLHEAVAPALSGEADADWVEAHLRPLVGLGDEVELGGDRRAEAFAAWRRFFEGLADQNPLVLVFEDLHWADEGLLDFVDYVAEWAGGVPILLVCNARPELLARRPGWGGGKRNATTISLAPLSESDIAQLVASLLEKSVLPAETQDTLLQRAGGNPLYAEEFARMLAERDSVDVALPETVQGLISARLDTLDVEEKSLLQNAAVIGKVFWLGSVAHLGDCELQRGEQVLHALERKEFVRRERRSSVAGDSEYAFLHVLVRDVAYGQIPRPSRAAKHAAAAAWIESLGGTEDTAEMLAHHYLSALEFARATGDKTGSLVDSARTALRDAGDRASALSSFAAAARFFGASLELWPPDDPERAVLLFDHAKASYRAGAGDPPEELLGEARDALAATGDRARSAETEIMLGHSVWLQGQRDLGFEHFERAGEMVEHLPPSQTKAYVLGSIARFLGLAGRADEAVRIGLRALEMAQDLGLAELCAEALNSIGTARASRGDPAGLDDLERSVAIAVEINSPEAIRSFGNLASSVEDSGDLNRAFALMEEAGRLAERFGHARYLRWLKAGRVGERYYAGRWDEALLLAEEFFAEVEAAGSPYFLEAVVYGVRARIRLARGDTVSALDEMWKGLARARQARDPQNLHPALAVSVRVLHAAGRLDEAQPLIDELLESWAESEVLVSASWTADLACVLSALGRGDDFVEVFRGVSGWTRWLDAARAYAGGDLVRAADVYAEIGSLPDEAFARLRAAEVLISDGGRVHAEAQLERALVFYRSVGATRYVGEGEAL